MTYAAILYLREAFARHFVSIARRHVASSGGVDIVSLRCTFLLPNQAPKGSKSGGQTFCAAGSAAVHFADMLMKM